MSRVMKRLPLIIYLAGCTTAPARPVDQRPGTPAAAPPARFVAGESYFGTNGYIEYIAGNAPIILTAPHGGNVLPETIPDRVPANCGGTATTGTDANTIELVKAMQQRYHARFGRYPHVIVARIARRKLDANRASVEAACGNPEAARALAEWHDFIEAAKKQVLETSPRGWYMDIHGHRHVQPRLELGYLLTPAQVNLPDSVLDRVTELEDTVSIRTISELSQEPLSAMLRGPASLGTLYAKAGFPSVPSAEDPRPGSAPYFAGGDNTRRHTCGAEAEPFGGVTGGAICGVQIESNFAGVRDTQENRIRFGDATAVVLEEYLRVHWGLKLASESPSTGAAMLDGRWTTSGRFHTFSYGNHISTVIFKARSTGKRRERAFAF